MTVSETETIAPSEPRRCPAPADFRVEVAAFDRDAEVGRWEGPRYRMTYRVLGQGPPLILVPGIAATYRGYALVLNRLAARFRTVVYDYPGEHRGDGADLARITHEHLVDDLFGLIEQLKIGRVFLVGPSFGSTVVFRALARESRRFPRAVVQGAFARRAFTRAERLALALGRHFPGNVGRLPLHQRILAWNNRGHFPEIIADRFDYYCAQNALTPIASLSHRLDLLGRLDLRPTLPAVPTEVLVLQGNEDRLVSRAHYDELLSALPNVRGAVMPLVGHQPHYTHGEALAQTIGEFLLPCAPGGCPIDPPSP
ncbi:MAG TPA: alpha/beta hydrolase [Isosphaeraceae bacterium]|jgi:pimeloyl-ACP methyl ester carboxylesterase|nr:alpha/beta hydrolase [Isosphaeraceae bacterium]